MVEVNFRAVFQVLKKKKNGLQRNWGTTDVGKTVKRKSSNSPFSSTTQPDLIGNGRIMPALVVDKT